MKAFNYICKLKLGNKKHKANKQRHACSCTNKWLAEIGLNKHHEYSLMVYEQLLILSRCVSEECQMS